MKGINVKDLKVIKKYNFGSFSDVFLVEYNGNVYCYKHFKERYPNDILNNINRLKSIGFSDEYIVPICFVKRGNDIIGYLSNYNKELEELVYVNFKKNKIFYLKQTKALIERLHNDYNRIHGDVSLANVLVDKEKKESYLIDFDSSLEINQALGSMYSFSEEVLDFINHYDLDRANKGIDIYKFNITTLKLLCDVDYIDDLYTKILKNRLHIFGLTKDGKKLCKELLLENRKGYSNEYIIDYV